MTPPKRFISKRFWIQLGPICALAGIIGTASAQPSVSLSAGSGAPGASVNLNISFATNGTKPTGAQWILNYSSTDFSSVSVIQTSLVSSVSGEVFSCSTGASSANCLIINISSNSTFVPNGIIAVATFQISRSTPNTSSQITFSNLAATDGNGNSLGLTGTPATITINQLPPPPVVSGLSCSPGTLTPPGTSSCTVTLSAAATSSTSVALSSGSASVTAPATVTIASGASTANFTANASSA